MPYDHEEFIDEPQNDGDQITNRRFFSSFFNFTKKHRLLLAIITVIIVVIIGISAALFFITPVVSINSEKLVNLDASVRLREGQTAKLKDKDVSVIIKHFTNDTCPKGAECFWSGQAVEYILKEGDREYATGSMTRAVGSDYQIKTVSSDYRTYAEIKIIKSQQ
jgi:uncharacterized membrane protein (Fun14 family)